MSWPYTEPLRGADPGVRPEGPFCVNATLFENLARIARTAEPVPELRDPRTPWRIRAQAWLYRAERLVEGPGGVGR